MIPRRVIVFTASAALVFGGAAAALASGAPASGVNPVYTGCVSHARVLEHLYASGRGCPKGQLADRWNERGPAGKTGPAGPAGPQGPAGAALGPVFSDSTAATINTGGKAYENATELGGLSLAPGTYLLEANFVATPNEVNAADIFPQLLVTAGGPIASGYATSIWNAGSGALESPTSTEITDNDLINSNFSGSYVIKVTTAETLYFYGFGYDSDSGAGTYTLNYANVSAIQLGS